MLSQGIQLQYSLGGGGGDARGRWGGGMKNKFSLTLSSELVNLLETYYGLIEF